AAGGSAVDGKVLREVADAAAETGVDPELLAPRLAELGLGPNGTGPGTYPGPGPGTWLRRTPVWLWLGAIVLVSSVVQFLLARRVLQRGAALAAAALAVVLPSLAYAGTLMTENVFYPLFLCFALALVSMLERPTARRQLLVLGLCVLLFLTRAQAIALVIAAL